MSRETLFSGSLKTVGFVVLHPNSIRGKPFWIFYHRRRVLGKKAGSKRVSAKIFINTSFSNTFTCDLWLIYCQRIGNEVARSVLGVLSGKTFYGG